MTKQAPPLARNAPLTVSTNRTAQPDIREVKPPVSLPGGWGWLALALGLALGLAAGWWYWRRRRRRARPAPPPPVIPPHVRARERLREALARIGEPEPFCVLVSAAIRAYLEDRFQLRAPERTTEEFLAELQESVVLARSHKRTLADFLLRCDLVKFARDEPGEAALRDLYDAAVRLVEETEPTPGPGRVEPGPEPGAPPDGAWPGPDRAGATQTASGGEEGRG